MARHRGHARCALALSAHLADAVACTLSSSINVLRLRYRRAPRAPARVLRFAHGSARLLSWFIACIWHCSYLPLARRGISAHRTPARLTHRHTMRASAAGALNISRAHRTRAHQRLPVVSAFAARGTAARFVSSFILYAHHNAPRVTNATPRRAYQATRRVDVARQRGIVRGRHIALSAAHRPSRLAKHAALITRLRAHACGALASASALAAASIGASWRRVASRQAASTRR